MRIDNDIQAWALAEVPEAIKASKGEFAHIYAVCASGHDGSLAKHLVAANECPNSGYLRTVAQSKVLCIRDANNIVYSYNMNNIAGWFVIKVK